MDTINSFISKALYPLGTLAVGFLIKRTVEWCTGKPFAKTAIVEWPTRVLTGLFTEPTSDDEEFTKVTPLLDREVEQSVSGLTEGDIIVWKEKYKLLIENPVSKILTDQRLEDMEKEEEPDFSFDGLNSLLIKLNTTIEVIVFKMTIDGHNKDDVSVKKLIQSAILKLIESNIATLVVCLNVKRRMELAESLLEISNSTLLDEKILGARTLEFLNANRR